MKLGLGGFVIMKGAVAFGMHVGISQDADALWGCCLAVSRRASTQAR